MDDRPAHTEPEPQVQTPEPKYKRLTPAQMHLILQLNAEGRQYIDIAEIIGVHHTTVSRFLKSIGDPHKVAQQIMQGDSISALTDWKRARRVAAKRGDHRPAREWLEAAYPDMRPQPAAAHGSSLTVVVALPGQDSHQLPTITVAPTQQPAHETHPQTILNTQRALETGGGAPSSQLTLSPPAKTPNMP